jgi:hypothetical protein
MAYPYEEFESDEETKRRRSVEREREACARIAESFTTDYGAEVGKMAKRIAEVIRRRA